MSNLEELLRQKRKAEDTVQVELKVLHDLQRRIDEELAKDGPKCGWCRGPLIRPLPNSDVCAICSANSEAVGGR